MGRWHATGRRLGVWALAMAFGSLAMAQEMTPRQEAVLDAVTKWKVANTLIFAILLGYALMKYAPRFFNARSADIQKAIQDATGLKLEADLRYSEIDRKIATLSQEVERLKAQSAMEMEREHDRLRRETQQELEHIQRNVQAEVGAFRQQGIARIRQHTAQLALGLAERRLRDRFAAEPHDFVTDFIHLVEQGKN